MDKDTSVYELIDHTADIGVRVYGCSMAELFEHAAFALFDVMLDTCAVKPAFEREFACRRDSIEELLVEWLGDLLYVFDTEHIVFSRFSVVEVDNRALIARAAGAYYDPARHALKSVIKAVTYHNLRVHQTFEGCTATLIFDT